LINKKLCYILDIYDISTSSHYFHLYELIEEIGKTVDLSLIVAEAKSQPIFKNIKNIYIQKITRTPLKLAERLLVLAYMRAKGYKKIYVHYSFFSAIVASIITKIFGGKTYYWNCGLIGNYMTRWKLDFTTIKNKILNDYMFSLTLKIIDYLVTGTQSMADYYSKNFGIDNERIKVIPNWVNLSRFNPKRYDKKHLRKVFGIDENTKVVLFIHWLSQRKGAQYIPEIAKNVIKDIPKVLFIVVGDGPYKSRLEHDIRRLDLTNAIKLVGPIPNREIARYFALGDVFILPSEEEGFPRVLLECMAMGVPFVVMDVGGVKDILTERQRDFMVQRKCLEAFIKKTIMLLKNESVRKELAFEGFRQVQKYEIKNVARIFVEQIVKH